jgi:hypothetical protein
MTCRGLTKKIETQKELQMPCTTTSSAILTPPAEAGTARRRRRRPDFTIQFFFNFDFL